MAEHRRLNAAGILVGLTLIGAWQLLDWLHVLDFEYVPAPDAIGKALYAEIRSGDAGKALGHTLGVVVAASAVALTAGTTIGVAIGLTPRCRVWVEASIEVVRTVPALMLIPIAVLAIGPTPHAEVTLAAYAGLWPMVLNTAGAVGSVQPRHIDVARTLQLSRWATVGKVVVPAAAPVWLVGARLSVILTLLVTIVVEMVISPRGVGGALIQSLNGFAPPRMWAYVLLCGLVGVALNMAMRAALQRAWPGHAASTPTEPTSRSAVAPLRGLLPLAVLLGCWQLFPARDSLTLPPPSHWLSALADLFSDGTLLPAIEHTLVTYLAGLAAATVVGAALGAVAGASPALGRAVWPSLDFVAAIPGAALVPVLVLLLGPNLLSGVAAVAVVVTWPVLMSTATARRAIPPVRLDVGRTIGLSPARRWLCIVTPSLAPGVLLGVRVSSALALIIALLTDIFGSGSGIGRLLVESQQRFDAAAAWGLLLIVGGIGYLSTVGLAATTRIMSPRIRQVASAG